MLFVRGHAIAVATFHYLADRRAAAIVGVRAGASVAVLIIPALVRWGWQRDL